MKKFSMLLFLKDIFEIADKETIVEAITTWAFEFDGISKKACEDRGLKIEERWCYEDEI